MRRQDHKTPGPLDGGTPGAGANLVCSSPITRHLSRSNALTLLTLLTLTVAGIASGQQYSIDWFKVAGGGGTSTGSVYSVSGTIGQPDAGTMCGGNYSLAGGFWGLIAAVQTTGAPLLTITLTTTNTVAVSWPSASTGFSLQQNTDSISSANWSNVNAGLQDDGTNKTLIVSPPSGNRFFRLLHQ